MRNIKLLLAYDGTSFLGWQKTPLGPSIEESLQKVLEQILQEKITLQAASRTDAGVHAEGQCVNFLTAKSIAPEKLHKSVNALLPPSIAVLSIEEVPLDFHPTLDNAGKEYHYWICNTPVQKPKNRFTSWHVPYPIDCAQMSSSAQCLLGTHDFSAFCNEYALLSKNPICNLYAITIESTCDSRILFKITGDRFLFRMVRNLVGTLVYIGLGKIASDTLPTILESKERSQGGVTAPAHGLHLMQVFYKNPILGTTHAPSK